MELLLVDLFKMMRLEKGDSNRSWLRISYRLEDLELAECWLVSNLVR